MLALVGGLSCGGDDLNDVVIETHVDDWRDEVIYQVVVDRSQVV